MMPSKQVEDGKRPGELDFIYANDPNSDALYNIAVEEFEYQGGVDVLMNLAQGIDLLGGTESFFQKANPLQDKQTLFPRPQSRLFRQIGAAIPAVR